MSQAAVILPGSPLTGPAAAAAINAELAAYISKFSGSTAPPSGPGISGALVPGQEWLDTSVTPNVWRMWDGLQWCPLANIDPTLHVAGTPLSWRNLITNGGFEVWQRDAGNSASIAVAAGATQYTADLWYLETGTNQACVVSAAAPLTNQSTVAAKVQRNSGQAATPGVALIFGHPFDTDEISRCRGQTITLSFTIKAGANWSGTGGVLNFSVATGTGTVRKRNGTPYTGEVLPILNSVALVPSQQVRVVATSSVIVPINTSQMDLFFNYAPNTTAGTDESLTYDDVQLEVGGMASSFERTPFDAELIKCKRHFWKTFLYATAPAQNAGANTGELQFIAGKAGTAAEFFVSRNPVTMRATPSFTTYNPAASNAQVRDETAGVDCSASSGSGNTESFSINATGNASTAVGNVLGAHLTADAGI